MAKSAIYCRCHFGEIHEIEDLERLELEHLEVSMTLSSLFIERSRLIRKIVRKKAARDKLMSELAGDTEMDNSASVNRRMGDAQTVEAFVGSSSALGSYVMDLKKDIIDQILDPDFKGQIF